MNNVELTKDDVVKLTHDVLMKKVDDHINKRRLNHIMKLFGGIKKVTVNSANIFDMMLKETCNIHLIYTIAKKMVHEKNSSADSFAINFEMVLMDCIKFGYTDITFATLAEMISVYQLIPEAWMIERAVENPTQLPEYSSNYYANLSSHPNIMIKLIKDLNDDQTKYRFFPTSALYNSLQSLKEFDYDWAYAATVLMKHRPSTKFINRIVSDSEIKGLLKNIEHVLDGEYDIDEDTSRSVMMAMTPKMTTADVTQPKKKRESIHIAIHDQLTCEVELGSLNKIDGKSVIDA